MPHHYTQDFTETSNFYQIYKGSTKGKLYYSADKKMQRIDRENGMFDRYCGSTYLLRNTPCTHYVDENQRYLHFPE